MHTACRCSVLFCAFTFTPPSGHGTSSMKWSLHTVTIPVPSPGTYKLSFVSTSTAFPAYGPVIDAVSSCLFPNQRRWQR